MRMAGELMSSAIGRLAVYILCMVKCEHDARVFTQWARCAHASSSTIREHCRLIHIKPRAVRDFARVLRAICQSGRTWLPETMFDCADLRTLNKMLQCAGLSGRHGSQTPTIREYFNSQEWIPKDHPLLVVLDDIVGQAPYYCAENRSSSSATSGGLRKN